MLDRHGTARKCLSFGGIEENFYSVLGGENPLWAAAAGFLNCHP